MAAVIRLQSVPEDRGLCCSKSRCTEGSGVVECDMGLGVSYAVSSFFVVFVFVFLFSTRESFRYRRVLFVEQRTVDVGCRSLVSPFH
jgi:hypothetical protein